MCCRFQIGSNKPFAKRNARMLSAASLPRKWSIRKIWLSSKVWCSASLSFTARREIRAERLLHDDAGPGGEPDLAELLHDFGRRGRRNAEIVEPADVAAELVFELADDLGEGLVALGLGHVEEPATRSRTSRLREHRGARTPRAWPRANVRKASSSRSSREVPTIRNSGSRPACARWKRPGRSLRRARSPVAPKSTITWGRNGDASRLELMSVGSDMCAIPSCVCADHAPHPFRPGYAGTMAT